VYQRELKARKDKKGNIIKSGKKEFIIRCADHFEGLIIVEGDDKQFDLQAVSGTAEDRERWKTLCNPVNPQ